MVGSARVDRRVFLSHSSKDKGDIERLAKALGERGIGVWGDVLELRLGQLCFENADDAAQGKLERRTERVDAAELGALLRERRVALFVLEACQTAMTAENPTASVEDPAEAPGRGRRSLVAGSSPLSLPSSLTTALLFPQDRCPVSRQRRSPRKHHVSPWRPFPPRTRSRRRIRQHCGLESRPKSPSGDHSGLHSRPFSSRPLPAV